MEGSCEAGIKDGYDDDDDDEDSEGRWDGGAKRIAAGLGRRSAHTSMASRF